MFKRQPVNSINCVLTYTYNRTESTVYESAHSSKRPCLEESHTCTSSSTSDLPTSISSCITVSHCNDWDTESPSSFDDLGVIVAAANGSFESSNHQAQHLDDAIKYKLLTTHCSRTSNVLHSHKITKKGKTWKVSFQQSWLEKFTWLSYSPFLQGSICRNCILFPESFVKGGSQGGKPSVLVMSSYQKLYSKALGNDGVLVCHNNNEYHNKATEKADLFILNFTTPSSKIDSQLLIDKSRNFASNCI